MARPMHEYLQDNPGLIVNGFRKASIQQAIDSTNETVAANDSIDKIDGPVTAVDSTDTIVIDNDDSFIS